MKAALFVDAEGNLRWRETRDARHAGRLAGSMQRGRRIVSIRDENHVMRTLIADRVIYAIEYGQWPKGRVVDEGGALVDLPRRARSTGRRGGKKAEQARDLAALAALSESPKTVSGLAAAVGCERTNVRRRLSKLAVRGLVGRPEHCPCQRNGEPVPEGMWRAWTLTDRGKALLDGAAIEEADLTERVDLNGSLVPWVRPVNSYMRIATTPNASARFG